MRSLQPFHSFPNSPGLLASALARMLCVARAGLKRGTYIWLLKIARFAEGRDGSWFREVMVCAAMWRWLAIAAWKNVPPER